MDQNNKFKEINNLNSDHYFVASRIDYCSDHQKKSLWHPFKDNMYTTFAYHNKNNMNQLEERKLLLIKFQPQEILFQHKETRMIYRYYNLNPQAQIQHTLHAPDMLLTGSLFNKGVIYPREDSNLHLEIEQRKRSFRLEYFSEEEILNTFLPLFSGLEQLHSDNITHGTITLENIVIMDGEVKLRDWLAALPSDSQLEASGKEEDVQCLGRCMLNCTFLTTNNCSAVEWEQYLLPNIKKFSKNFILTLIIFIKQLKPYYKHIASIMGGENKHIDAKLNEIYDTLMPQRSHKKQSPKHTKSGELKSFLTLSPAKKLGITHKRVVHHENIENKVEGGSKKLEKSKNLQKNSQVHELMSKKLNEEEKKFKEQTMKRGKDKAPIINLSSFGIENNSKKYDFKDRNSPLHKLRTFSKKK